PQESSREDGFQYNVTTSMNAHQLLAKKWNLNIRFSYAISEEKITPEYDTKNIDIRLKDAIENASKKSEKDQIKNRSSDYAKRTSINFIGVRKERAPEQKVPFYDIENFTLSQTFNQLEQRNFEIERNLDQQ